MVPACTRRLHEGTYVAIHLWMKCAFRVWNAVDTSKRQRIKLPADTACETLRIPPQDGCERAYESDEED